MSVPNQVTHYSWGTDCITDSRYVTFERPAAGEHTYTDPSVGSWSRLMRALTISRIKPKLALFLRQHAMMEFIDRKAEEAKRKRR